MLCRGWRRGWSGAWSGLEKVGLGSSVLLAPPACLQLQSARHRLGENPKEG